jgi:MFS family permease
MRPKININYGWLILFVCTLLFFNHGTVLYSYSVYFKPLAETFNWSRAQTSIAYSLEFGFLGVFQIFAGWVIDRLGPGKLY